MADIELVGVDAVDVGSVALALEQAFGRPFSPDWLTWKHQGPWGPAEGVIAIRCGQVVGCRFLLPWTLVKGDGRRIPARRAVEAATTEAARGTGLFRRMNERALEDLAGHEPAAIVFSSSNANSLPAYRKMGWTILDPVAHAYQGLIPRPARVRTGGEVLDSWELGRRNAETADAAGRMQTDWSAKALRWRFDERSGNDYEMLALREADEANGLVGRVVPRRVGRILMVAELWGGPAARRTLLAAALWRVRAAAVLGTVGPGALDPMPQRGRRVPRGQTNISVWQGATTDVRIANRTGWALTMSDIEGLL